MDQKLIGMLNSSHVVCTIKHCVLLLGVSIKVLVVDLESDQVLPPISVQGEEDWSVGELKTFLKSVSADMAFK